MWAAVHLVTRKAVALKVLKSNYAHNKPIIHRFLREARAACAVRHPNVVQIHDVIEVEEGLPVMVMDLLEGESLGQRLLRHPVLSVPELAAVLGPVVSAVGAAHALGIVHRDLKPDNIFLAHTATGTEVKVLDFGIAKLTATEGDSAATGGLTGTGAMLGTPYYMAPEQIYGEKDIDQRCDVWAIGVIMYECLAGVRPTQAESVGQILRIVTRDGIKPLRAIRPDLPPEILEFVDRLLQSERDKRPKNMAEIADVLSRYSTGTALLTTNPRGFVPASTGSDLEAAPTVAATLSPGTTTVGKASLASRRAPVIAVSAFAVVALGTTIFFATRDGRRAGTPNERIDFANDAAIAAPPQSASVSASVSVTATATPTASATPVTTPTAPTATTTAAHKQDAGAKATASVAPPPASSPAATAHTPGGVVDKPPF